jgi:guanylate kinase
MGPSGCGKSTVIERLSTVPGFEVVAALTTRAARGPEVNRICVSDENFRKLLRSDRLLLVNQLYGHWYGTPSEVIDEASKRGQNPIIDCPVERVKEI